MESWKLFELSPSRRPSMTRSLLRLEVVVRHLDSALNPAPAQARAHDAPMRPARMQQQVRRSLVEERRVGREQVQSKS